MTKRTAIFRCDSSVAVGGGHVMRCLTVAQELYRKGWRCIFSVEAETLQTMPLLRESGFRVVGPRGPYLDEKADVFVIDSYNLSKEDETVYRAYANSIVVLDDLANRQHDCDILLDQTFGRQKSDYEQLVTKDVTILVGSEYALLRPQFSEFRAESLRRRALNKGVVEKIFICFGGTDPYNMTSVALDGLANFSLSIVVVVGSGCPHIDNLGNKVESMLSAGHKIDFYQDVDNMAELMKDCDIAIGAGGTASWERCCLGLPSILIELADNQQVIARNLMRAGAVYNLGCHEDVNVEMINGAVSKFIDNPDQVLEMSIRASNICDGHGIEKLYRHLDAPLISIQYATIEDAERIYKWRNSDEARKASTNPNAIPLSVHMAWLKESLNNPLRDILIFKKDGESFGVLRFDYDKDTAVISIYLAAQMIGQGLGTVLLQRASSWLSIHKPEINKIYADVLADNIRSKKAFLGAGYQYCGKRFEKSIR